MYGTCVCTSESGPVAGEAPTQVPDVALILMAVTVTPLIAVGTVTIRFCVAPVDKATGLAGGVVIANAVADAPVTMMSLVAVTDTAPAESSHSAVSTTVPATVGVNVRAGVTPTASVVSVVAESVPAPVLAGRRETDGLAGPAKPGGIHCGRSCNKRACPNLDVAGHGQGQCRALDQYRNIAVPCD